MRRLGIEFDQDADRALVYARQAGWVIASELRSTGIDLSFAPCVDLDRGVSEIIGDRAFHTDPEAVAKLAGAFCNGLRSAGMSAVAKHFPGHGAVVADSHEKLPVDRREYGDILDDMRPYDRLISNRRIAAVMLAHVVYPEVDELPAGFSKRWIRQILRGELGFDGAIFCDDLSMKATTGFGAMPERARLALDAGCDMVLVCNDRPAASATVASLADYSNPLSLVRLVRLHGTGTVLRETLQASDEWHQVVQTFEKWLERPPLEMDA
jgi:beta-N-acetylhexosaminidase